MLSPKIYEIRYIAPSLFLVHDLDSDAIEMLDLPMFQGAVLSCLPRDIASSLEELLYARYEYVILDAANMKLYKPKPQEFFPPHIKDMLDKIAEGRR